MAEFVNPFSGQVPERPLSKEELIRAIRLDIAAEHEATHLYMAHAEAIDDPLARAVLIDIANEERVHVGEFMRLLSILTGDEDEWLAQGVSEVDELDARVTAAGSPASSLAPPADAETVPPGASGPVAAGAELTLGSLRP